MVDRVPSKEFSVFIRKIGYSVGLEHTLERLNDFARLYGCQDTLSYADISRLLHSPKPDGWGLDRNNEHILDVLRSLALQERADHGERQTLSTNQIEINAPAAPSLLRGHGWRPGSSVSGAASCAINVAMWPKPCPRRRSKGASKRQARAFSRRTSRERDGSPRSWRVKSIMRT